MSLSNAIFILLIGLDGPIGNGIPALIGRFDGPDMEPISAEFVRQPAGSVVRAEIAWFLDGDSLGAAVGTSPFQFSRGLADSPAILAGHFPLRLPEVNKPTRFVGVVRQSGGESDTPPLAHFRLQLFPRDHFSSEWERLAREAPSITLCGQLSNVRDFLQERGITFREGEWNRPETLDRSGLVVAELTDSDVLAPSGVPAKAALIYGNRELPSDSVLVEAGEKGRILWISHAPPENFGKHPITQQLFLQLIHAIQSDQKL